MTRPHTVITSDSDLYVLWCGLMGPGGFGRSSLWIVFLDADGLVSPVIVPIDDIPEQPDEQLFGNLASIVGQVLDDTPGGSAAFLLSRPGAATMTRGDRAWARMLAGLSDPRLTRWPVHLATTDLVRVFAAEDLFGAA